ncbi:MAG: CBS domain-containing protein [Nanoarchaeota archaeon]
MEITPVIKDDFLTFDDEATFSTVIGKLKQSEMRSGLVFRKDKYLGLIEKRRLLGTKIDITKTKIKPFIQKTPLLNAHADIIETSYLMYQSNFLFLPVEKDKKIIGVVDALDLIKLGIQLPEIKQFKIADLKLFKPKKINKDDPVSKVVDIMFDEKIDQVPIFEAGKLYGVVSYHDLLNKYLTCTPKREFSTKFTKLANSRGAEPDMPHLANLPVSTFSTNDNLVTIGKNAFLTEAVVLMVKNNVTSVLVMDGTDIEGVLSLKNVLRCFGSLKIPQNFNIQFIGLKELKLNAEQKAALEKIASNEAFKLQRELHNEFSLVMHIKDNSKEGKQNKYSVHLRVEFPGQIITCAEDDWDFETALRKTFNNAKNKLKSKFKGNNDRRKQYE